MKVEEGVVLLVTLDADETAVAEEIAERDGITIDQAVQKAVENFLSAGVQTPNPARCSA